LVGKLGERFGANVGRRGRCRCGDEGIASGIDVTSTIFVVVTVDNGRITRLDEYMERAEALEAGGLSE